MATQSQPQKRMKKEAQHKFRISRFYLIYFTVTIFVVLAIIVSLGIVSQRLAEYEAAQPKYVAEEVFNRYFNPIDFTGLLDGSGDVRYNAGSASTSDIIDYLKTEIGDGPLTYSIGSSNNENEVRYIVKAGKKQLASITLAVSDKTTKHGMKTYEFSHIELYLNTEIAPPPVDTPPALVLSFDVPASYSVTVDGTPLSTENVTSSHIRSDILKHYPAGITGVDYTVYTLRTLTELPKEVIVTDMEGTRAEVTFDEKTNTYTAGITYSASLAESYTEFVTEAIEGYAAYVQVVPGFSLGKIDGYFDKSSDAYADVEEAGENRWMVKKPSGNDFENVVVGEFYAHSSSIFSCHISFTQILHREGSEDYPDVVDKYVFLHQTEDGYKIFAWYNA